MGFLATELRPPRADGGERITRLAAETGAAGIHVGAGCDLEILATAPLVGAALRLGLEVPIADAAARRAARSPRGGGCRGSAPPARDEREAAIALAAARARGRPAAFGARLAVVDFGGVALAADAARFARAFARRAVGGGRPGRASCSPRRSAERRARSARDSGRLPLRARAAAARRRPRGPAPGACRSGSPPGRRPARASSALLRETFGAALGVAWDPARLSVLAALDLPVGRRSPARARRRRRCWSSTTTPSASTPATCPASASATSASPRSRRRPASRASSPAPRRHRRRGRRARSQRPVTSGPAAPGGART